nr:hypothetical protein OAOJGCID_00001 [African swine fever virus]
MTPTAVVIILMFNAYSNNAYRPPVCTAKSSETMLQNLVETTVHKILPARKKIIIPARKNNYFFLKKDLHYIIKLYLLYYIEAAHEKR